MQTCMLIQFTEADIAVKKYYYKNTSRVCTGSYLIFNELLKCKLWHLSYIKIAASFNILTKIKIV